MKCANCRVGFITRDVDGDLACVMCGKSTKARRPHEDPQPDGLGRDTDKRMSRSKNDYLNARG